MIEKVKESLTVEAVARELQLHEETIRRWIRDGVLGAFKWAGRWRIPREAVEEHVSSVTGIDRSGSAIPAVIRCGNGPSNDADHDPDDGGPAPAAAAIPFPCRRSGEDRRQAAAMEVA